VAHSPARAPTGIIGAAAVVIGLAGTLLWIVLLAGPYRLVAGLVDSGSHLKSAEAKLSAGVFAKARYETLTAVAAADRAEAAAGAPLLDVLAVAPVVGDALGEVDHLVAAAKHSADAAVGAFDVASGALEGPDAIITEDPDDADATIVNLDRVEELGATVRRIRAAVVAAKRELESVDVEALPRRVRPEVVRGIKRAGEANRRLSDAAAGIEVLPGILGAEGPRHYLIGSQNSAEQRGTGGALLQYSLLKIEGGRLSIAGTESVYEIDRDRTLLDIPLPEDAFYVREIPDAQRFGNANWSPDWPLSAGVMLDYARAADDRLPGVRLPQIDGFIAVDPVALEELLPGVGPFIVCRRHRMTAGEIVEFTMYRAYGEWPTPAKRRRCLREVVDKFIDGAVGNPRATLLLEGAGGALTHKHIQIWMADAAEEAFVKRMDWDGAIEPAENSDYLYVVEQNVGGNKLDYFAENLTEATIELTETDALVSTTTRVHNGVFMPQPRRILGDRVDNEKGIHYPMMNVYVPGNAVLTSARADGELYPSPEPARWSGSTPPEHSEKGKTVWSASLMIPPNEERSVTFEYRVPGVVRTIRGRSTYRLTVQHQPKVNRETLLLELSPPDGARDIEAKGWKKRGDLLIYDDELTQDMVLEVSWRS
jgi:hypothetical protein